MSLSENSQRAGNARVTAMQVLIAVIKHGRSLNSCLNERVETLRDPRDRALAKELCYGVLRWYHRLSAILEQLLNKPLRSRDADVQIALLIGVYQILYARVPSHAAVDESVKLTKSRRKSWAGNMVNGVLRTFLRDQQALMSRLEENQTAVFSHPEWLIEMVRSAWPDDWQAVLQANNEHPPMSLRVNEKQCSRDEVLAMLANRGIAAHAHQHARSGIALQRPIGVEELPGFAEGLVSVQDGAAQLSGDLLAMQPGHRILDACAAPGGKTALILERSPADQLLTAVDIDTRRLERLHANLRRLKLSCRVVCADVADVASWWDGVAFERVLLDAPCTGSGVIRRHPDIKLLRGASDLEDQSRRQEQLLEALWHVLAPAGQLLYATCSIVPLENDRVIERFLNRHEDAQIQSIDAEWGRKTGFGRQILPGDGGMDGFYYAVLVKT